MRDWHMIIRNSDNRLMWSEPTMGDAQAHMDMLRKGEFHIISKSQFMERETIQRQDEWGLGTYLI